MSIVEEMVGNFGLSRVRMIVRKGMSRGLVTNQV
jgi:hypothetical protein